jgi:glycosyltransferase involved in cell wall biosynthesis
MKRVAIVYHYFAHYRYPVLKELANSKEVDYTFIADTDSEDGIKTIDFYNDKLLSGKFLRVKNSFFKKFIWQKGLTKILNDNKYDAVIFLGEDRQLSTWFSLFRLKFSRTKSYLWSHGLYGREEFYRRWMRVFFMNLANGDFVYNNRAKKLLVDAGIAENKLHVIYNSLDFDNIEKVRGEFSESKRTQLKKSFELPDAPTIYCISRINKSKKIDMLIEAIHQLKEKNFILNGFIIGDGPEVGNLKKMVEDYDLQGQIIFVGPLYDEKTISEHIMSSDLCVCPGAIGLTAIHSLSYGVPVVSNDNYPSQGPEFEAIEPGVTGDFFEDGNVIDMAEKIQQVLKQSARNKPEMVENCLKVVKEFYNPVYQKEVINKVMTGNYA